MNNVPTIVPKQIKHKPAKGRDTRNSTGLLEKTSHKEITQTEERNQENEETEEDKLRQEIELLKAKLYSLE